LANGTDHDALLAAHQLERRAHLDGDAELLATVFGEHVWEASRGQLTRLSRADIEARFRNYFASVRYAVWDDLVQPHVWVAPDGLSGWIAVHIEARLTRADESEPKEREFESAWIATYEKVDGKWLMTGIASSVVDRD
jgi:hypothetical protein